MSDEPDLDRRSFLRRASSAGLVGLSGVGGLGSHALQDGDGEGANDPEQDGNEQDGPINYFQAVLPVENILDADLVYRIVVVGGPILPHERPPPLCFPEGEEQWRARDALVVKPTEATGISEDGEASAVNRSRVYLEQPVEPGTVYRITGGEYCDGHALVTVHELPPRLSEYFNAEMLDIIDQFQREEIGNQPGGNASSQNETPGNDTFGTDVLGNETAGNETAGNETVGNGTAGNGTE